MYCTLNDLETAVSASFEREIHVVCLLVDSSEGSSCLEVHPFMIIIIRFLIVASSTFIEKFVNMFD